MEVPTPYIRPIFLSLNFSEYHHNSNGLKKMVRLRTSMYWILGIPIDSACKESGISSPTNRAKKSENIQRNPENGLRNIVTWDCNHIYMDYIWINYGLWFNYGYNVINILSMGDLQDPIHGGT